MKRSIIICFTVLLVAIIFTLGSRKKTAQAASPGKLPKVAICGGRPKEINK